jgi:surface protein
MFSTCGRLTSIDLSNFDTSRVTEMKNMFAGCPAGESVDHSKFTEEAFEELKQEED